MDQPVVVLQRLPESVIEKYLNKEMKVFEYNQSNKLFQSENFINKKYIRKKPHWIKRGLVNGGYYNKGTFHKQSNYKIMTNGFGSNFHEQRSKLYNKAKKFHSGKKVGSNFIIDPNQLHNSEQSAVSKDSSELENTSYFSKSQDRTNNKVISSEQLLKQGKKRYRSGEKKINTKDSASVNDDYCEDINENLIQHEDFNNYEWQIVSEASCSDVSRDSSPSRENLLDAEYSVHTELENNVNNLKQKVKLTEIHISNNELPNWQDVIGLQKEKKSQASESDEDDRLTEPYKSECEEETDNKERNDKSVKSCKSHIRIKIAGSHKNGFTSVTDECDKLKRNDLKIISASEPTKSENNHTNVSIGHSTCSTSSAVSSSRISNKSTEKAQLNVSDILHSSKLEKPHKEVSSNSNDEFQKNKNNRNVFPFADNSTHYDSEVKNVKHNSSQLDNHIKREGLVNKQLGQKASESEKSDPVNVKRLKCLSNTENKKENVQNGPNVVNKESKFNRYDYVGLIMQTMDKSAPYSVSAKSDDTTQKTNASDENQNISFKPNGINKAHNYKETSILPGRKEFPPIPCFKQKKARMSRVTSMSKSFLCKDLKGPVINKMDFVNHISRPVDTHDSQSNSILIKGNNEKDIVGNVSESSNKKLNTQILTDKQKSVAVGMKTPRRCWRCGKQFGVTDRLCKQCNSIDYTAFLQKISNIQPNDKSKDTSCNLQKDSSTEPILSDLQINKRPFKVAYNHWKNKSNSSVKQNSSEWSKSVENADSFHNKSTMLPVHNKNQEDHVNNIQTANANLSPLKLVVSLGLNKLVEKTAKDKDIVATGAIVPKKLKKKRMRSASDTVEGIYETNRCISVVARGSSSGNLICKISKKKRKHKDLPKRRKKPKLEAEDESSDISDNRNQSSDDADHGKSGYYSEDNITSRCKSKDTSNEHNELSLNQPIVNQPENEIDNVNSKSNKSNLNKKGNCEVRNVKKGLFLLSFSETDEELYQLQSNLHEFSKRENKQILAVQTNAKEDNCSHLPTSEQPKNNTNVTQKAGSFHQVDTNIHTQSPSDSAASNFVCHKLISSNSCPTLADLQELVAIPQSATKTPKEMSVFQNLSSVENTTTSNKVTESENHICEDGSSENKSSMPRIESVYSLKDVQGGNKSDDKRTTEVKMPFLFNHNIYNELDAYTTASILDMDGTKERSLTVLMSLLSKEYKELQYIHQAAKKTEVVNVELQNEKLRHIDNIRTLQLACALFKQCQKCNKELSPEMLNLRADEISQLLTECGNGIYSDLTVIEKSNVNKDFFMFHKLGIGNKQQEEGKKIANDNNCVTSGISGETKMSGKSVMHTTNTRKTVKFLLEQQKQLESSTNTAATTIAIGTPAAKRKSDDDVICIGVSQLPKSSAQVVQPLDQRNSSQNDVSNGIPLHEAINNKSKDSQTTVCVSPNAAPPNVSVIKSHGLASPPAISNFITSSASTNSIPLQVIPGLAGNHPLQAAVNVVTSAAAYQKTAVGYVKQPNYSANSLSIQKEQNDNSKQQYVVSQLSKLPNGTSWIQSGIQNQWSSHSSQVLPTSTATNEVLSNIRNQGWRNNSPIQSSTPPSVPNQQKSVQQMPLATNPMLPLLNQYGTAVTGQHVIHGGLPVQAGRNLPPVPPMYNHSTARAWHQSPNPLGAALRPAQQTPVVCIACRKPIGMTCPTGMFCSDICKKSYCAHFPSYR